MATRVYRLLLLILPGWFREEFAAEMTAVFRDSIADARAHGRASFIRLWITTVADMAALASRLHLDAVRQDVTYALRTLGRSRAFTFGVVATLAIGFGPALVLSNFVYQLLIAPLPFSEPGQLVRVWNARPERNASRVPLSIPDFMDYREGSTGLAALAAHTGASVALVVAGNARQVSGVVTSHELHDVLRVYPILGRALSPADTAPGGTPVIVLGATLWRSEFGGRSDVIGQVIHVDGVPNTVVGVLPDGIPFPQGSENFWRPFILDPANDNRGSHFLTATGRLAPGVSREQAEERLNALARTLAEQFPETNRGLTTEVFGLREQMNGDAPRMLAVLGGAIGAVLLIACLNVAGLLSVRTGARTTELSMRTALGASTRRLRRQLLVEHLVLTGFGGAAGAVIGVALHRLVIQRSLLPLPPRVDGIAWPAFIVVAVLVIVIAITFGWIAVRKSARRAGPAALVGATRHTDAPSTIRSRQVLVGVEVAAALVLLVFGGLMLRSVARLAAVDPGFRTEGILTFGVVLPGPDYRTAQARIQFAERVTHELKQLPGVREAAVGAYAPMGEMRSTRRFAADDRPLPAAGSEPLTLDLPVGPAYFDVMGIPLLAGHTFTERDSADAAPVMIVNEAFARTIFPGENAIGKRIRFYSARPGGTPPPTREIVGIVRDVRHDAVRQPPIPVMYTPYAQTAWAFLSFFILADGDPVQLAGPVQRVVSGIDPMRPARDVATISTIVQGSAQRQRATTWLLIALAATALLMATIGLYGVSATAAAARMRELAIRSALGANPSALMNLILRQGLVGAVVGVVLGAVAAVGFAQGIAALLYETPPHDPATFLATAALLITVAAAATVVPARRALKANPAALLRSE